MQARNMQAPGMLAGLARNNAWANFRLLKACAALSPAELAAERSGFFPSILETLAHILMVDRYYLAMLEGWTAFSRDQAALVAEGFAAIKAGQEESDRRLISFCEALGTDGAEGEVVLIRDHGVRYRETVGAVLLHLFQHDIHHRGQVHAMLSSTGVAPPQLDEFFLEQDADIRRADLAAMGLKP